MNSTLEIDENRTFVPRYEITDKGVCFRKWDNKKEKYVTEIISSCPISITGVAEDIDNGNVSYEITHTTASFGRKYTNWYAVNELTTNKIKNIDLMKQVNLTDQQHTQVCAYLNWSITENKDLAKYKTASKFGWRNENIYVIGNKMFTESGMEPIITQPDIAYDPTKYIAEGSLKNWIEAVKDIIDDPTVRINCYAAVAAPLLKLFGVSSFLLDHYGKTSSGKTFGTQVAASMFGNPKTILIDGRSSLPHIEKYLAKVTSTAIVIDETSLADPEKLEAIIYTIANETGKGKATHDTMQQVDRWSTVCLISGEDSVIKTNLNGAGARAISHDIEMKTVGSGLIETYRTGIMNNYGHIVDLYMTKILKNKEEFKKDFVKARKHYIKDGQSNVLNRMGSYFAVLEVAGSILESVFKDIGIETKESQDIVNVFYKYTANNEQEEHHIKALRCVNDHITKNAQFIHENGLNVPSKTVFGYRSEKYLDIIPQEIKYVLKKYGFSEHVIHQWKAAGIIVADNNRDTFRITVQHDKSRPRVYRFDIKVMDKVLN